MAVAAYCSQCDEYIYVTAQGGCPRGHPAEALSNSYEVPDAPDHAATPVPQAATQPQTPAKKKRWVWSIVGLVLVFLLLCCGCPTAFLVWGWYGAPGAPRDSRPTGRDGTVTASTTTWTPQTTGMTQSFESVSFGDAEHGCAVGWNGTIVVTSDGGATWTRKKPDEDHLDSHFVAVKLVNAKTGWVVGHAGAILKTTDGGETWVSQASGTLGDFTSVDFVDENTGWALGEDLLLGATIYKTTDGGATWKGYRAANPISYLTVIRFSDASHGMVVGLGKTLLGSGGIVARSVDGGETWTGQSSGTSESLWGACIVDPDNAWVVGSNKTLLHTKDGGARWSSQDYGVDKTMRGIDFGDPKTGWAVGDDGAIIGTTDGGNTWSRQSSPTTWTLDAVDAVDADHVWAVGMAGTILKGTPAGK